MKINDQPAQFISPAEVRIVRLLPGPIDLSSLYELAGRLEQHVRREVAA